MGFVTQLPNVSTAGQVSSAAAEEEQELDAAEAIKRRKFAKHTSTTAGKQEVDAMEAKKRRRAAKLAKQQQSRKCCFSEELHENALRRMMSRKRAAAVAAEKDQELDAIEAKKQRKTGKLAVAALAKEEKRIWSLTQWR